MVFQNNLLAGAGGQSTSFDVDYSCIFDAANDYLAKTYGSAGNRRTMTFSCWVKRSKLDSSATNQGLLSAGTTGNDRGGIFFSADELYVAFNISGSWFELKSNDLYRDTNGWMHVLVAIDTTEGTASDRTKIYVNGSSISYKATGYVDENAQLPINDDIEQVIGAYSGNKAANDMFGGYMSEIFFIDGTALAPTSFGKTDSSTGQWIPIDYEGSYGSNGYRLSFGTSGAMGDDTSGNENDFSLTGIAAANQSPDTPTLNKAVLNGVQDGSPALADGNLKFTNTGSTRIQRSTTLPLHGKVYWEVSVVDNTSNTAGIHNSAITEMTNDTFYNQGTSVAGFDGATFYYNGSSSSYSQPSNGQRWMFAFDGDTGEFWSGVNGTWHNSGDPAAGSGEVADVDESETWYGFIGGKSNASQVLILGSDNMSHTVPSGFTADLTVDQLSTPTIKDSTSYAQPTIYTGNGSTQSINQAGNSTFDPDLVWIKNRDATDNHCWFDSVRGATKVLYSNTTGDEETDADTLTAFESDGFALGADVKVNTNTEKYVGWQWLEGATGGFDIVSDTGTGSARTISHSLSSTPEFIIRKKRTSGTDDAWIIWHVGLPGANYYLNFDTGIQDTSTAYWNNTLPTSSVFSVGASNGTNQNTKTFITYLFRGVDGFSKFGKYTGNGSTNGIFVNCNFKPAIVILKRITTSTQEWQIYDNQRSTYNTVTDVLQPNANNAEETSSGDNHIDFLTNGFKLREDNGGMNADGSNYIYAAWAVSPLKYATAR